VLVLVCRVKKKLLRGETESIMTKFQQKYLTESEDTTSPEHYLWISVLSKAAHDAIYGSDWRESKSAISWFKGMSSGFREVCELAGRDPYSVHSKMQDPIKKREMHMEMVRREGRYYVKDTKRLPTQYHSHYRGRTKLLKNKDHAI
tara:strand:- start:507 stop:944 length:438 start_codon:yes stop_codon:yes gene_type:complete